MSFEYETGARPSTIRSRTVRVEMDSGRYVDFVRFDAGLDVDRMLLLETALRDADAEAAEGTAPPPGKSSRRRWRGSNPKPASAP